EVAAREAFAAHFENFPEPWLYATAEEAEERLRAAGFAEVHAWLQPWEVIPPDPEEYMRTLILKPQMEHLPAEIAERYLADVRDLAGDPLRLRYVRLNIDAVAP